MRNNEEFWMREREREKRANRISQSGVPTNKASAECSKNMLLL